MLEGRRSKDLRVLHIKVKDSTMRKGDDYEGNLGSRLERLSADDQQSPMSGPGNTSDDDQLNIDSLQII